MSVKINIMVQSKIKIDLDSQRRPCISVFQPKEVDEPVDKLLKMFIEDLRHTSKTLVISFDSVLENGYNATILPVTDELDYFKTRMYDLINKGDVNANTIVKIDELFDLIKPKYNKVHSPYLEAGNQNIKGQSPSE